MEREFEKNDNISDTNKNEKEPRKESMDVKEEDRKEEKNPETNVEKTECTDETKITSRKQAFTIDEEAETKLKELSFYHGYLPREDISFVLRSEGDFLLRMTELGTMSDRQVVISVMTKHTPNQNNECTMMTTTKEQLKLRNIIINRRGNQYRIDDNIAFPTVKDLVEYFSNNNHVTKVGTVRLKKGIFLQKWEYDHKDVTILKELGSGAFGEVMQGVLKRKKGKKEVQVAVKRVKGTSDTTKEKVKEIMREARIMRFMKHKNVVRLYGVLALEQPIGIILELVDGGALNSYLKKEDDKKTPVDVREKIQMCSGAANGLSYIHSLKIIHRDVAARNCLYSVPNKVVKISDFGLSRVGEDENLEYKIRRGSKGQFPTKWLAPDTLRDFIFSQKTDVYSYGILVFEIFANGQEPWTDLRNADVKIKVMAGEFLKLPPDCPTKLRNFVQNKIFVLDRHTRVTMGDVVRFMENMMTESKMADVAFKTTTSSKRKTQKTEVGSNQKSTMSLKLADEMLLSTSKTSSSITARSKSPLSAEVIGRTATVESLRKKHDSGTARKANQRKKRSKFGKK